MSILWPRDHCFESARVDRVFNQRRPVRHPLAIVKASSHDDVRKAIELAKELKCNVSVRSGGHSWAGWSIRDDSVLVDLGGLNAISFDETTGIVKAGPAVTADELNSVLVGKNRIFNGPHCPSVGLGGFLLQGGIGWNCRGWGWSAEQIVGIDVVTAEGLSIHCSHEVNSDLFWSARGSGPGFFAVVTQFHLQTRPIPAGMLASNYIWDISEYDVVMPWLIETSRVSDRNVEIFSLGFYPDPSKPTSSQRIQLLVHLITFNDSVEDARKSLELFSSTVPRRDKALVIDEFESTSLAVEFLEEAKAFPPEHRYCADNAWIHSHLPTEQVVETMRDAFMSLPTTKSSAMYFNMAPEPPISDMALSLQTEHWLTVTCVWNDFSEDTVCQEWLRLRFIDIEKASPGLYIGDSDFQIRKAPFLARENAEKLENIRKIWDPQNIFCSYLE